MKLNLIRAVKTLFFNPGIVLLLVAFLLIFAATMPTLFNAYGTISYILVCALLFLLTSAFLSGWLCNIKEILENTKRTGFFGAIPIYMPAIMVFILIFIGVEFGIPLLSDKIFGNPDNIIAQITALSNDQNALMNFFSTLSHKDKMAILERGIFCILCFVIYHLLTIFSLPALFYSKKPNPFLALKEGAVSFFKKVPLSLIFLFIVLFCHIFLLFLEAVSISLGYVASFISMVLRIYYIAFFVVLLFVIYEENFCDNGGNSLGENETIG